MGDKSIEINTILKREILLVRRIFKKIYWVRVKKNTLNFFKV